MIFKRIDTKIDNILKRRQITRMRVSLKHQRNVVSVKQIKQIVGFLEVEIARMALRCVFFKEMSVSKNDDMPISLIFLLS